MVIKAQLPCFLSSPSVCGEDLESLKLCSHSCSGPFVLIISSPQESFSGFLYLIIYSEIYHLILLVGWALFLGCDFFVSIIPTAVSQDTSEFLICWYFLDISSPVFLFFFWLEFCHFKWDAGKEEKCG